MAIEIADDNSKLSVTPWFEKGYVFKGLTLREEIGGNLASGVIRLTSDGKDLSLVKDQNTIDITYTQLPWDDTREIVEYKVKGYIYHREFIENEAHLSFVAVSKRDFSVGTNVRTFDKMKIQDIITELYPDKDRIKFIDNNNEFLYPDVNEPLTISQNALTNLDLCKRLCRSYRKDSVFAFGLEGLFIKNVFREQPEPIEIIARSDSVNMNMFNINDYKEMTMTEVPTKDATKNLSPIMYGFDYYLTKNSDYYPELLKIHLHNSRYSTALNCSMKLRYVTRLPKFKLGDIVKYRDPNKFNADKKYIVTYISIEIERNEVVLNCEISSWEDVYIPKHSIHYNPMRN